MTEQNTPIILDETEEPARQLVQLAAEHEVDYGSGSTMLLTASLKQSGVHFRRMASDEGQRDFSLDAQEMDAACAAWATFKHKQEQKAKAEEERQAQIVDEAYELTGTHIKIEPDGVNVWTIACPAAEFESGAIFGAESLLRNVKAVHERYRHLWSRKASIVTPVGGDAA